MEIKYINPNGYCSGVVKAVRIVVNAINSDAPKPIHVYGMLIHNKMLIGALTELGVNTIVNPKLSDLDNLTGTVIFTAHGVLDTVKQYAIDKNLHVIDSSCKDVVKIHNIIKKKLTQGFEIIFVGKKNHPEANAVLFDKKIHLVETIDDLERLKKKPKYFVTNQTTLNIEELKNIFDYITNNFNSEINEEICSATRLRQLALKNAELFDLVYIVGDQLSNNANSLTKMHKKAILIESVADIDEKDLSVKKIGIAASASTPKKITEEVYNFLLEYKNNNEIDVPKKSNLTKKEILSLK